MPLPKGSSRTIVVATIFSDHTYETSQRTYIGAASLDAIEKDMVRLMRMVNGENADVRVIAITSLEAMATTIAQTYDPFAGEYDA